MGEVWVAEHTAVGGKVALKTLLPATSCDHEVVARFKREAYLLGKIRSDHVARVLDFVSDETHGLVLVMEFVEGPSLASLLQHQRLTIDETIDLGIDVLSALCDLHLAHVVHRDLKPGNILMRPQPDGRQRAVVVDFGVSRLVSAGSEEDSITGITKANMALGTLEYMAPEQILNSREVTAVSDLYAVGALLFRAVAGKHAYGNATDSELAHKKLLEDPPALSTGRLDQVGRGLEAVVNRALKRRPAQRYPTAAEMLADLTAVRDAARVMTLDLDAPTTETYPIPDFPQIASNTQVSASPSAAKRSKPQAGTIPIPSLIAQQLAAAAPEPAPPPKQIAVAPPREAMISDVQRQLDETDASVAREPVDVPAARPPMASVVPISEPPVRRPARGGVPMWMFGSGMIATLALGAVIGKVYTERVQAAARSASEEPTAAGATARLAEPDPGASAAATNAASAGAIAEAAPDQDVKTMRGETPVDLGEIDPAQPPRPRPVPTAPTGATGASTAQPSNTARPAPMVSPSATSSQDAPKPIPAPSAGPSTKPSAPTSQPRSKSATPKPTSTGDDPFE
jgi:serine/threonine-protein kinase